MRVSSIALTLALGVGQALAAAPMRPAALKPAAPTIEGVVQAPDGRPVEGALVTAHRGGVPDPAPLARTDAKGQFRIVLKADRPHDLRVEKVGLATADLKRVRPGRPLTVRLERGGVIRGEVRDGTTRKPLAGVRVECLEEGPWGPQRGEGWEAGAGVIEATTDANGRFELQGVGLKLMNVSAVAPGYSRATQPNVGRGADVALVLFPGASISGIVTGVDTKPVAGALVKPERHMGFDREAAPRTETTDPRGRFVVAGVKAGRYSLTARAENLAPAVLWVTVEPNTDTPVELRVGPGASVSGRLVNSAGDPVAGSVRVQEIGDLPTPYGLADLLLAEAQADGRFRIERLPLGSHSLAVTSRGLAPRRVDFTLEANTDLGDIALESGLTIRGRLRDRAGFEVVGARLWATPARASSATALEATSNEEGSFAIGGLEPGTYRVHIDAAGYAPLDRNLEAGADTVEIVLDAAGAIAGCVVDALGQPITSYRVDAQQPERDGRRIMRPSGDTFGAADGCFLLENVAEGTYIVTVSAPEHPTASVSDVMVSSGGTTDVGRVHLGSGAVVHGTVVDSSGSGILGASVSIDTRQSFSRGVEAAAVTAADGAFELSGIPAGVVDLVASHPEYAPGRATGIEVEPAEDSPEARIVLSAGGRIEGSLRKRDGAPVSKAMVTIMPLLPSSAFTFTMDMMRPLRDDGSFSAEHVTPGRCKVMVMAGDRSLMSNAQERDIEVREGETTTVDFVTRDILVAGHVTRSGLPAPNLRVSLSQRRQMGVMVGISGGGIAGQAAGPQRLTGTTREDGSYELLADEPGPYGVSVGSADGKASFPSREVELPDVDTYVLDLDFTTAPLTGVVVDRATGKPVDEAYVSARPKRDEIGGGSGAVTGPDGRFALELDPGEYTAGARAPGYAPTSQDVSVPDGGLDGLRLALAKGATLTGKVVDAAGRGVGDAWILASRLSTGTSPRSVVNEHSLPDGTFRIEGLPEQAHDLAAARDGRFAVRPGVTPGDEPVTLQLRPGGQVALVVRDLDGAPVEGAWAFPTLDGIPVPSSVRSDANGMLELAVPAGTISIEARKDKLRGATTVEMVEGAAVSQEVVLAPAP
jgi:hypothetical protein